MIPLHKINKEVVVSGRLLHFIRAWQSVYPIFRPLRITGEQVDYYSRGVWVRLRDRALSDWINYYPDTATNIINWHLVTVRAERIHS